MAINNDRGGDTDTNIGLAIATTEADQEHPSQNSPANLVQANTPHPAHQRLVFTDPVAFR